MTESSVVQQGDTSSDEECAVWREALFVFDTNVLKKLLRSSGQETTLALVDSIELIPQNRRWIPCQVHEELRRLSLDELAKYSHGMKAVRTSMRQLRSLAGSELSQFADIERLVDEIESALPWSLKYEELQVHIAKISSLFTIGSGFSPPRLCELCAIAAERYSLSIPPGYKDHEKTGLQKYADAIIWFEIIEEAKARHLPVVLVTNEQKEDWWEKAGNLPLGPHPSLVRELRHAAQTELMMYDSAQFMDCSAKYLGATVSRDLIEKASTELASETAAAASQEAMAPAQWVGTMLALPEMAQTVLNSEAMRHLRESAASYLPAVQRMVADSLIPYQGFLEMMDRVGRRMSELNPPEQQSPPTPNNENK